MTLREYLISSIARETDQRLQATFASGLHEGAIQALTDVLSKIDSIKLDAQLPTADPGSSSPDKLS